MSYRSVAQPIADASLTTSSKAVITSELAFIASFLDVIRTKNKIAAEIALSVAKKDKPIEVLTSLVPEITDLAKQLKELVDSI